VRVRLPVPAAGSVQFFTKVGTRAALAISKVVVAFAAGRDGDRLEGVRIAAGSVAPVPLRLGPAEQACEGRRAVTETADAAAEAARGAVRPLSDVRSEAGYRRWVLGRVVRRMILDAGDAS
jgi:CO/xanthine dehydrogenase FAD-binding subunit